MLQILCGKPYTLAPATYGNLLSQFRSAATKFFLFDGLGSTDRLTDSTATVTDTYVYEAFGTIKASTGSTTNPFRYVGQLGYYHDQTLLQYQLRLRLYMPSLGRFLTTDPSPLWLHALNPYNYAANQPTLQIDPSGLKPNEITVEHASPRRVFQGNCGLYAWPVKFTLKPPPDKAGYVVQEIFLEVKVFDCQKNPINDIDAHYLEAWKVEKNVAHPSIQTAWAQGIADVITAIQGSSIQGFNLGIPQFHDLYVNVGTKRKPGYGGKCTKGSIFTQGRVYFLEGDTLPKPFKPGGSAFSGQLLSLDLRDNESILTFFTQAELVGPSNHTLKVRWECCPKESLTQVVRTVPP